MKDKPIKFIFQIPRGHEEKWKLYRKILSEFDLEPTERIWNLIENDMDRFIEVAQLVIKKGDKENEE